MKVHVLVPTIVIDITFYCFEAGQKLVGSQSNYFCMTDNANIADNFGSIAINRNRSRSNYFVHDGQCATNKLSISQVGYKITMLDKRELTKRT